MTSTNKLSGRLALESFKPFKGIFLDVMLLLVFSRLSQMLNLPYRSNLCFGRLLVASLKEGYAKFECQKCEKPVELGKYVGLPLCPKCGTYLVRKPVPKHWIFQFNPTTYRWFDRIKQTNEPEQWLTSQNAKLIRKGDLVAVWGAGKKSGIYAIGQVTTNPRIASLNPKQEI